MRLSIVKKETVWRGRGRPPRQIPDEVKELADATYRTGNVGQVHIEPEDEEDAVELQRLLRSYAKQRGLQLNLQRDEDELRFEMVDRPVRKKVAA
jgi:hypothetical protein